MAIPEGIYGQLPQGAVAEDAMHAGIAAGKAEPSAPSAEDLPAIYRSLELDFWAGLNADQAEAVRRMQQTYVEHMTAPAEQAAASAKPLEGDDQLLALASPRLITGGFMMGGGFFATLLSLLDILGPGMLWFGLPIALLGLILSLDNRN